MADPTYAQKLAAMLIPQSDAYKAHVAQSQAGGKQPMPPAMFEQVQKQSTETPATIQTIGARG